MNAQNNFGPMIAEYDKARRGYPDEVYNYLKSLTIKDKLITLDIGCGTGISTRELKEHLFEVTGVDKDEKMIQMARTNSSEIPYIVAFADKLPFDSGKFDIVTAFTSFHWFNDEESLSEIKRVLTNGGIFFAALKTNRKDEDEDFRNGYFSILKKYAGNNFDVTLNHFNKEFLVKLGFSEITEKTFDFDEQYTVEGALTLIRSLSSWNLVEENKRSEMIMELKKFYENHSVNGLIIRARKIAIVSALKK